MRASILICVVIFGVRQHACAAELDINARTLGGWTVTGGISATAGQGLTLPAAGHINRSFATGEISLRLVTSPAFGIQPEDWAIIEIGSAAIAFVRSGDEGRIVLLRGQADPVTLSYPFKLDASGYPLKPLELEFGVQGNAVSVVHANEVTRASFEPEPNQEVTVSAGAHQPWVFARFIVQTAAVPVSAPASRLTGFSGSAGTGDKSVGSSHASSTSRTSANLARSTETKIFVDTPQQAPTATVSTLEVFTPPSVRQRIADHLSANTPKTNR